MDDDDDFTFDDQATNLLGLFGKRQGTQVAPTASMFSSIFNSLLCGICKDVLLNPVYTKCSHRFCKQCIEKFIRSGAKKVCPNCKSSLTTKRDLRYDYGLSNLITIAFGDPKDFTSKLGEDFQSQRDAYQRNNFELRRTQSVIDAKKNQNGQDMSSAISLRRTRTVGSEDGRRKKRKKLNIQIQNETNSVRFKSSLSKDINEVKKQSDLPQPPKRRKRNNVTVIQIESSDPVEVEQIPPQQFFIPQENIEGDAAQNRQNYLCSISMIPELSQLQSAMRIPSGNQGQKADDRMIEQKNEKEIEQYINQTGDKRINPIFSQNVINARSALKAQFGSNFLSKIIELSQYSIFMLLAIRKHPNQPFTPELPYTQIKILANALTSAVSILIAQQLGISKDSIRLYVCQQKEGLTTFIEVGLNQKLQEINNRFWRSFGGFQITEVQNELEKISNFNIAEERRISVKNRFLYFSVDFSKAF